MTSDACTHDCIREERLIPEGPAQRLLTRYLLEKVRDELRLYPGEEALRRVPQLQSFLDQQLKTLLAEGALWREGRRFVVTIQDRKIVLAWRDEPLP